MRLNLSMKECCDLSDGTLEGSSDSLFQKAVAFSVLDPRPFATPLETPRDRVIHLKRSAELKLGLDPALIESLMKYGFSSLTLLSLISAKHLRILGRILRLDPHSLRALERSINMLNESPLEPLYSLKKYILQGNKRNIGAEHRWLDILHLDKVVKARKAPPPPKIDPAPVVSQVRNEDEDETSSSSSSSLLSSGVPNISGGVLGFCPLFFCPRHGVPMDFPTLFRHIFEAHNPFRAKIRDPINSPYYGAVELEFSLSDAAMVRPESVLWFGPTEFVFDGIPFYEIVYRITAQRRRTKKLVDAEDDEIVYTNYYVFWLFAGAESSVAGRYSYVISLFKDKDSRTGIKKPVTSFEKNPSTFYNNEQRRISGVSYFTFDESRLKNVAFPDGTLKYFVKVFKNRPYNNNSHSSSSSRYYNNYNHHQKRRQNYS